jgi:mono/diheme cytochrome c family protein
MDRGLLRGLAFLLLGVPAVAMVWPAAGQSILRVARSSAGDLEVGGELNGVPAGAVRSVRYQDLLRLPQETYTVSGDANLPAKTEIEGVPLETLARMFGRARVDHDAMLVAICYDKYRTTYPPDYVAAHHPLLVLKINGQLRDRWPKTENGGPLGPYLISHPMFKPAFQVLSHADEPQIPFGVTRIELRRESVVFGTIRPPGEWPEGSQVAEGYAIARQDCFRCHNMGDQGGTMAGMPWLLLAQIADQQGKLFRQIVRNPASVTPGAKMPAHPDYNDATLDALTAYFRTFAGASAKTPAQTGAAQSGSAQSGRAR